MECGPQASMPFSQLTARRARAFVRLPSLPRPQPAARRAPTLSSVPVCVCVCVCVCVPRCDARAVSWEIFRCKSDCKAEPDNCISERLYHQQADALVSQGFLDMGYNAIHMDDCWERKIPPRDVKTGRLVGDPIRFPCATATDRSSAAARFTLCLCS
eukprot:COSAG06_NODE_14969_length_1110_cov_3.986766_2_plen_157_part_00